MSQQFTPLSTLATTPSEAGFKSFSVTPTFTKPAPHSVPKSGTPTGEQSAPPPTPDHDSPMTPSEETENSSCQSSEPTLVLDRDGDRIIRIRVLCGCGQSVTIKCDYLETEHRPLEEKSSQRHPTSPADSSPPLESPGKER